jgi:hypothetical protein
MQLRATDKWQPTIGVHPSRPFDHYYKFTTWNIRPQLLFWTFL